MRSLDEARGLMLAAFDGVADDDRSSIVAQLIQRYFDDHKEAGTVPALVGALLNAQAVVMLVIGMDGQAKAEYSLHVDAVEAVSDAVASTMRAISVTLDAIPSEEGEHVEVGGA